MKRILIIITLLLMPLNVSAQEVKTKNVGIKVDRYDVPKNQIEDAKTLSKSIDIMSKAVGDCMKPTQNNKTAKNNTECICDNADKLANLKKLYYKLLSKHPEWKGKMLYYEISTPEIPIYSYNTYLPGLETQFAIDHNCKK